MNYSKRKRYKDDEANIKDYKASKKRKFQGLMGLDTYILARKADIID